MRNPSIGLTAKQLRWIDEYLVDFNGAAAAVRAGYSEKSARSIAHENATKPDIQAALKERQAALAKRMQMTQQGVARGLLDAFELAKAQRQPSAMVASMAALAKLLGLYAVETKRVEFSAGQSHARANYLALSDAELLALIEQGAAAA